MGRALVLTPGPPSPSRWHGRWVLNLILITRCSGSGCANAPHSPAALPCPGSGCANAPHSPAALLVAPLPYALPQHSAGDEYVATAGWERRPVGARSASTRTSRLRHGGGSGPPQRRHTETTHGGGPPQRPKPEPPRARSGRPPRCPPPPPHGGAAGRRAESTVASAPANGPPHPSCPREPHARRPPTPGQRRAARSSLVAGKGQARPGFGRVWSPVPAKRGTQP